MSTPSRFDDKEYTNWIKCSLALTNFKEGLHDFIKTEVTNFHAHIQQNIANIPCGSSAGSHCGSCTWKSIKHTGGQQGVWYINCQNKICDKWLYQVLLEHNDPHNRNINWKNADISKWPTDGYEVAKVYMPKGQDKTNNLPDDFDAPAILSLLKYCAWFTKKIQTTSILSDLIDLRNEVMHSSDLRVTDINMNSCIDKMIQLLSELKIHGNVCTELKKTKTEDIDVNFRETEVRALHNLVLSVKEKMDSLQDAQTQQMLVIEEVKDKTTETEGKVVAMETDIEGVKFEVEQLTESYQKIKSFLANNPDIHDKNISENMQAIEKSVIALESKLEKKHEEIERKITSMGRDMRRITKGIKRKLKEAENNTEGKHQERDAKITLLGKNISGIKKGMKRKFKRTEEKHQEIETKITSMGKNISGIKKGIKRKFKETGEKHQEIETKITLLGRNMRGIKKEIKRKFTRKPSTQKDISKAPEKRRPETDGLRQLKNQTEDKLDTFRCLKCIPTKQAEEAMKLLEGKRSIVIKGNPGEGKTTTALHLIDNEMYKDKRVVLYSPQDWMKVDTEWVDIVVLEDIFGQFDLDSVRLQEWMVYLPTIQEHVDAEKLQVIINTRDDILSKAYSKLGSLKLFSEDLTLTLSSNLLLHSEKISILNRELQRHNKNIKEDEKEKCVTNFSGLVGFPQCCLLFAGDSKLFDRGPDFFKSPCKFFVANIRGLEAARFLSLAFLFCHGTIYEENLSPGTMPETSKHLLAELASNLNISERNATITLLRDAYDSFLELYVVKSIPFHDFEKPCIQFAHATVSEAVGQVLGDHCVEMVVKYADSEYLYQRTYTAKAKDSNSQNIFIPVYVYKLLAERMVRDVVYKGLIQSVVKHSSLKQHDYLIKLKSELQKGNQIKEFFLRRDIFWIYIYIPREDMSTGECKTFMQYILQCDEEVVRLVYSELLEFLECAHNNNSSDCWQCEEKQKLLELSLYYHHFEIADKLITMNACYTHVSLCNAAIHGDLVKVQTILEGLKRSQVFNPGCEEAKDAFCRACYSGNQDLIDYFLQEGIIMNSSQVVHAVQYGDITVLKKVVEHLKRLKCNSASKALQSAYGQEKYDMYDVIVQEGVSLSIENFPCLEYTFEHIKKAVQDFKDTGNWDPTCDDACKALEYAYLQHKYDMCDLLVQEGVSLTMQNLSSMVDKGSFESIKKAIQNMKDAGIWDPKCENACIYGEYDDVFDLLAHKEISPTVKNLIYVVANVLLESIKKAVQNLKDSGNWDPKCDDACKTLQIAYRKDLNDICDLLIQEGVSLTMKNLSSMVDNTSLESIKKAIQNMKDTGNWDPKCDDASETLENACKCDEDDVCDLLVQEGISQRMKNLTSVVSIASSECIKKVIKNIKDAGNWDPKCDDASETVENACKYHRYDVRDLLVQEGVSLTMKNLSIVVSTASYKYVKRTIQHLIETDNWDPGCDDAYKAFLNAYSERKLDVCGLLVQKGVQVKMKSLSAVMEMHKQSLKWSTWMDHVSMNSVKKEIKHLKDTDNWDPECDDAYKAFLNAYSERKLYVRGLQVVQVTVKRPSGIMEMRKQSLKWSTWRDHVLMNFVQKGIKHLKDTGDWDPKCDDASKALEKAFNAMKYDVCDLLVQEGVSLTMKSLSSLVYNASFECIEETIQHLKDTDTWDPECDDAHKALVIACRQMKDDVCDLLTQNGVSLTMKNLPGVVCSNAFECIMKVIQHLKDAKIWDPECDDASEALENAYKHKKYDVCDLLIQEGVSFTTKNRPLPVYSINFDPIKIAIQNIIYIDHCIHCMTCRVTQNMPVWNSKLAKMVVFHKTGFSGILAPRFL